jgi:hypothetical protein
MGVLLFFMVEYYISDLYIYIGSPFLNLHVYLIIIYII